MLCGSPSIQTTDGLGERQPYDACVTAVAVGSSPAMR